MRTVFKGIYKDKATKQVCGGAGVEKKFKDGPMYDESFFSTELAVIAKAGDVIAAFNQEMQASKPVRLNRCEIWWRESTGGKK